MSLDIRRLSKTFPGQKALRGVDLTLRFGEVHALVGQNGSGKSTLIKILSGYHEPDDGASAEFEGRFFRIGDGSAAHDIGLRFVHQDLGIILSLSILDNLMLGQRYPTGILHRIQRGRALHAARQQLSNIGLGSVDPTAQVSSLALADRALVAIARALIDVDKSRKKLIVLDEPTAALAPNEVEHLLAAIRKLTDDGHGVLLVSHHLSEVISIADRITVLRDGEVIESLQNEDVSAEQLSELIAGYQITGSVRANTAMVKSTEPLLEAISVAGGRVSDVSFEVGAGEIVGIAGLAGSGRESLGQLLAGQTDRRGTIAVDGVKLPPGSPSAAIALGMITVPGERGRYGLFPNFSVRANLTVSDLKKHRRWNRIAVRRERQEVEYWIREFSVATTGPEAPIHTLSGGNQQKILLARALRLNPKVLLLDDPTVGIDIGARRQVHNIIVKHSMQGIGVVLISTDSQELSMLCDRVLILSRGAITRQLVRTGDEPVGQAEIDYYLLATTGYEAGMSGDSR